MPRSIQVYIWGWRGLGIEWGRVGHAMIADPSTQTAILSQFPHKPGDPSVPYGPNTRLSYGDTYRAEGGQPDAIFGLSIADADCAAFDAACADHLARPFWDWDPAPPTQTHCARSCYDALVAGGIPIDPAGDYVILPGQTNEILPNSLWTLLAQAYATPVLASRTNLDAAGLQSLEDGVVAKRDKAGDPGPI